MAFVEGKKRESKKQGECTTIIEPHPSSRMGLYRIGGMNIKFLYSLNSPFGKLAVIEFGIEAFFCKQLLMVAHFDNASFIHHQN